MLAEHKGRPVMGLKDKVAIVTAGAHGMGASEPRLFMAEGAKVIVADIRRRNGRGGHPGRWRGGHDVLEGQDPALGVECSAGVVALLA